MRCDTQLSLCRVHHHQSTADSAAATTGQTRSNAPSRFSEEDKPLLGTATHVTACHASLTLPPSLLPRHPSLPHLARIRVECLSSEVEARVVAAVSLAHAHKVLRGAVPLPTALRVVQRVRQLRNRPKHVVGMEAGERGEVKDSGRGREGGRGCWWQLCLCRAAATGVWVCVCACERECE